jgi:hypothetical protein
LSQELVKVTAPKALSIPPDEAAAVQEAFAINIASGTVSEFDLPRIKVMSGAALWLIPSLEGDETAPKIEGVLVVSRDARVYYASKDAGNVPPDCSSTDAITGIVQGKPGDVKYGGACQACPMSKWDSAQDGGGGQACKQVKQLFFLRGDSMFPEVVSLPPTSVKAARQFLVKLTTQGIPYYGALVAIELEKAQNAAGKPYGRANMKFLRRLSPDEQARAVEFHQMCQQFAGRVHTGTAADAAE